LQRIFPTSFASAIAVAEEVIAEVNSQQRETFAQRLQSWHEFEHEMRERDEASRAWHQVQQDYPDQFAWMHAPDPPDEQLIVELYSR